MLRCGLGKYATTHCTAPQQSKRFWSVVQSREQLLEIFHAGLVFDASEALGDTVQAEVGVLASNDVVVNGLDDGLIGLQAWRDTCEIQLAVRAQHLADGRKRRDEVVKRFWFR